MSLRGCNIHLDREWSEMQSVGPLTRHARDLAPILTVLAGENVKKLSLEKYVSVLTKGII